MSSLWTPGEIVTAAKLNKLGGFLLYDSVDAGVSLPVASITTPSLDQTFAHLLVIWKARSAYAGNTDSVCLRVNGNTGASYYDQILQGLGAVASAGSAQGATYARVGTCAAASVSSTHTGVGAFFLPHYAEGTAYKNVVAISAAHYGLAASNAYAQTLLGMFGSGAAVTTLTFMAASGNLAAPSRFSVYGIPG